MKLFGRALGLLGVGLGVAAVVYPLLHELGHILATVLAGGSVERLLLQPMPGVVCEVSGVSVAGRALIGLGGMLLPLCVAALPVYRGFWLWYAGFVLRGICGLSFAISAFASAAFALGKPQANEDVTRIMELLPDAAWWGTGLFAAAAAAVALWLVRDRLFLRCSAYFGV